MVVDLITGNAVALSQRKWNSNTGINGTIRHLALFSVIGILLPMISFTTNLPILSNGVMIYVIGQYTISILENMSSLGIDMNEAFGKYFEYLSSDKPTDKQDDKGGE